MPLGYVHVIPGGNLLGECEHHPYEPKIAVLKKEEKKDELIIVPSPWSCALFLFESGSCYEAFVKFRISFEPTGYFHDSVM